MRNRISAKQQQIGYSYLFGGDLDPNNRWIILKELIPWGEFDEKYSALFADGVGAPAISFRVALGALIVQTCLGLTDAGTVSMIKENVYIQAFLGFSGFTSSAPFCASSLTNFRKRISPEILKEINDEIIKLEENYITTNNPVKKSEEKDDDAGEVENEGDLVLDATCVPQDIRFPQDASLLNEARIKLEKMIDILYKHSGLKKKPRTYRRKAKKVFKKFSKGSRKKGKSDRETIREIVKELLVFVKRDLGYIDTLLDTVSIDVLSDIQQKNLEVIRKLYAQQKEMLDEDKNTVDDRIISISQPYVRTIVRGKARNNFEFGAKLSLGVVNGLARVDRLSWKPYNEAEDLKPSAENYKRIYGCYPARILADNIYKTKDNKQFCAENGIQFTGVKTIRKTPLKDQKKREVEYKDMCDRQVVESIFGVCKRKYGLDLIRNKTEGTSETQIHMEILVYNLSTILRRRTKESQI